MNICLFEEAELGKPLAKHDERAQHIVKVLHKRVGDHFDAGVIGGKAGVATITHIGAKGDADEGALSFTFAPSSDGKPLYPLALIVGFPRPIQLRRLLRDVAGLGVCAIHLTGTELGEKSYMESTLVEKGAAYNMLLDGTAQAASTHVPALYMHKTLTECLDAVTGGEAVADSSAAATVGDNRRTPRLIALDNVRAQCSLHRYLYEKATFAGTGACGNAGDDLHTGANGENVSASGSNATAAADSAAGNGDVVPQVIAAIGSERGWTDRERALLEQRGFVRCSMGCRVLRTESAATVASALILDALGKLD